MLASFLQQKTSDFVQTLMAFSSCAGRRGGGGHHQRKIQTFWFAVCGIFSAWYVGAGENDYVAKHLDKSTQNIGRDDHTNSSINRAMCGGYSHRS